MSPIEEAEIDLALQDFWERSTPLTDESTVVLFDEDTYRAVMATTLPTYAERCAALERIRYERRRRAHYHEPNLGSLICAPEQGGGRFIRYVWDEEADA
jgi:hypothetical protein